MKISAVFAPVIFSAVFLSGCAATSVPAQNSAPVPAPSGISKPLAAAAKVSPAPVKTVKAPAPSAAPQQPAAPIIPAAAAPKISAPKMSAVPTPVKAAPVKAAPAPRCEEDQPCWDCVTMGNKICGADGINPECAEQSMETAPNGSCLPTECPIAGQVMDLEGTCAPEINPPGTSDADWRYDCDTSGYKFCKGPNYGDAWESFDALTDPPVFDDTHVLTYVTTVHTSPAAVKGSVVVKSVNLPKTWHIFQYTPQS